MKRPDCTSANRSTLSTVTLPAQEVPNKRLKSTLPAGVLWIKMFRAALKGDSLNDTPASYSPRSPPGSAPELPATLSATQSTRRRALRLVSSAHDQPARFRQQGPSPYVTVTPNDLMIPTAWPSRDPANASAHHSFPPGHLTTTALYQAGCSRPPPREGRPSEPSPDQ